MVFDVPWRMNPDNFTPPTRTPWGGRVILDQIKAGLPLGKDQAGFWAVGESWEVSVEPNFPSRIINLAGSPLLSEVVACDPVAALGPTVARRFGGYPLLVKLLDSASPLSVQVHPGDDCRALAPHQSGKPEFWYVVGSAPRGGLYLGLKEGVERPLWESTLASEGDLSALLNFVPVHPGDCFEIAAGTIHAIGAGVTLVEPQRVIPGKEGVTYRLWDWNRRYDETGRLHPDGRPRALHLAQSLEVIAFDGPRGESFVSQVRRHPIERTCSGGIRHQRLLQAPYLQVDAIEGTGRITLEYHSLLALVLVRGRLALSSLPDNPGFRQGESLALPATLSPVGLDLRDCLAIATQPGWE